MNDLKMIIDGKEVESASRQRMNVIDPATEKTVGSVPKGNAEDVDRAVKAARQAFRKWSRMTPGERSTLLLKLADALDKDVQRLGEMETSQTGKPHKQSTAAATPAKRALDQRDTCKPPITWAEDIPRAMQRQGDYGLVIVPGPPDLW